MLGWQEYFSRRPIGWREDNRAAIIAMSFGGKAKPEDLFESLKILKRDVSGYTPSKNLAEKLFDRFANKFTEKEVATMLRGQND
jgi:hypothetical protein